MNVITKVSSRYGFLLALIAAICTALSAGIYFLTKDKIDQAMAAQQQELLSQVIPKNYFDNNLLDNSRTTDDPQLAVIQKFYAATQHDRITAYAYETTAPDGYSGNIRLLVGITPDGKILGVRVLEHHETPGLGDKIELRISNWILSFSEQKITPNNLAQWAVKKDGGKFDQFSGATITPRAVVNQVKSSALLLIENQQKIQCLFQSCEDKQ